MIKRFLAAAVIVWGFGHAFIADGAGLSSPPSQLTPVSVVEFYNASLDHYFMTADPVEANALDTGVHLGWARTGFAFTAYSVPSVGAALNSVCRFYGRPEAGLDSHFYSAAGDECRAVTMQFGLSWLQESANVFRIQTPDRVTGACPYGTSPVYRLFNNRTDANHRYTVTVSEKRAMQARGYIAEGYGPDGVAMCAVGMPTTPPAPTTPTQPAPLTVNIVATQVAPDTFDFASSAIPSSGAVISSYQWAFGDGTTGSGPTSSHQFTISGVYPVVLTVTDSKGVRGTSTKNVTVTGTTPAPAPTPPPPSGASVIKMPPATSLTNSEGVWTLSSSGHVLLNGKDNVGAGIASGGWVELLGDTIALNNGANPPLYYVRWKGAWSQWANDPTVEYLAPAPAYTGPSNSPDIWSLEMTDYASLRALAGYDLNVSATDGVHYAFNPEYGTDATGIKYLRFSNNPNRIGATDDTGSTLIAWFLPIRPGAPQAVQRDSVNVRYLVWLEDDVATASNDVGVKLPGPSAESGFQGDAGELVSWRTFHKIPVGNTFAFSDYRYDYTQSLTGTYPSLPNFGVSLRTNRWYVIEVRCVLNTPGVPDGYGAIWVNGNKVFETTTHVFRTSSATKLRSFHFNFYHGGHNAPKALMHYRIAKLAMSSSYIGVPSELMSAAAAPPAAPAGAPTVTLATDPSWRKVMTQKDKFQPIANTATLNGLPDAGGSTTPTIVGGQWQDIDTWNGFAADATSWWGVAMGGHAGQWSNKVIKIDFSADAPKWTMEYAGSPYSAVPSYTQMDSGKLDYYFDGLPTSRHTYYANHYIGKRNRVMMFYDGASYGAASHASAVVDGYRVQDKQYDPKGTWSPSGIFSGSGANSRVPTAAKHPITEDVYVANSSVFQKWSQATGQWSTLPVATADTWQFHGSLIDGKRNRWVYCDGGLHFIDLTTLAYSSKTVTGDSNFVADAGGDYSTIVHDLDNDRYLLFTGNTASGPNGKVYAINPDTAVATLLATIPAAYNGVNNRATYFQSLGGVVYLPEYGSNVLFMPTR